MCEVRYFRDVFCCSKLEGDPSQQEDEGQCDSVLRLVVVHGECDEGQGTDDCLGGE